MALLNVQQYLAAVQRRQQEVEQELQQAQTLARQSWEKRTDLEKRRDQAQAELVAAILPTFDPATLDLARRASGYQALSPDLIEQMGRERLQLQERVSQIEFDPRFQDRDRLRNPDSGELTLSIARVEEHRNSLMPFVQKCLEHPRFLRLIEVGYGTKEYKVGFWRLSYYLDWKAGDEVMEKFPDKRSFQQIRDEYLEESTALKPLDERLAELKAEWDAGVKLETEYNEARYRLDNLQQVYLDETRAKLGAFMADCPAGALGDRLAGDPQLEMMAKRWMGLQQQARYLNELNERQLGAVVSDLQKEKDKLGREFAKYSRPKHYAARFDSSQVEGRLMGRHVKVSKRLDRYSHNCETVYIFDDYHHASLAEDFLWWDLITDGELDGNFIPEVEDYYRRHPGYQYERRRDWDDSDAAASVASSDRYGGSTDTRYDAS